MDEAAEARSHVATSQMMTMDKKVFILIFFWLVHLNFFDRMGLIVPVSCQAVCPFTAVFKAVDFAGGILFNV